MDRKDAAELINSTMESLDLRWQWKDSIWTGLGMAKENVWSRAARRKQRRLAAEAEDTGMEQDGEVEEADDDDDNAALVIKITVEEEQVDVRWVRGRDSVLFESFCGMLKRALRAKPP